MGLWPPLCPARAGPEDTAIVHHRGTDRPGRTDRAAIEGQYRAYAGGGRGPRGNRRGNLADGGLRRLAGGHQRAERGAGGL
ncbi:UNVERIFIED_CONTAM: hypothetical protein GTU68_056878 [Idotea baltica]|nr:hypothetical protein [Idotea baltica]